MARKQLSMRNDEAWKLNEHLIEFVNNAFGRRLRPSRTLYDAIVAALDAGYQEDDIRLAFWCARCIPGQLWIKDALTAGYDKGSMASPEHVLRFRGGMNNSTGVPAKRWLDDLISRADEVNPVTVEMVLKHLPESIREDERQLLERNKVPIGSRGQQQQQQV